jgi:hypothetical protein
MGSLPRQKHTRAISSILIFEYLRRREDFQFDILRRRESVGLQRVQGLVIFNPDCSLDLELVRMLREGTIMIDYSHAVGQIMESVLIATL